MSEVEHTINLTSIEADNFPVFTFHCHHHPLAEKWACYVDEGDMEPDPTMLGVCWLSTWWEGVGVEMLDLRSENFCFPMPVRPEQEHGWGSEPRLVVDYEVMPLWRRDGDMIESLIHHWDEMKNGSSTSGVPFGIVDGIVRYLKSVRPDTTEDTST